jgi:FixJ family two-component response regulator
MRLSFLYDDPDLKAALAKAEQSDIERLSRLTRQQRVVLGLICDGQMTKQAAHTLGLSHRTVDNHRAEIMDRTECQSLAELMRLYFRAGGFYQTIKSENNND